MSGDLGLDIGISVGTGVTYSNPIDGVYIIGLSRTIGVGASLTAVSGGVAWGQMGFY